MRIVPLRALLLALAIVSVPTHYICAEAPPKPGPPFDQIFAERDKAKAEVTQAFKAFEKVVADEEKAKNITPQDANILRSKMPNFFDLFECQSSIRNFRVPTASVLLYQEQTKLDEAVTKYARDCARVSLNAENAAREVVGRALRQAQSVDDVAAALRAFSFSNNSGSQTAIGDGYSVLYELRRLIEAQQADDASKMAAALYPFLQSYMPRKGMNEDDRLARVEVTVRPFKAAVEAAQKSADTAIMEGKADVTAALSELKTATARLSAFDSVAQGARTPSVYPTYEAIAGALAARSLDDEGSLSRSIQTARGTLKNLDFERATRFERLLNEIGQNAGAAKRKAEKSEDNRRALEGIKNLADLEQWIANRSSQKKAPQNDGTNFTSELQAIAEEWKKNSIQSIRRLREMQLQSSVGVLAPVYEKALRGACAQALEMPELLKPPFDHQSLRDALDALADQLAKQKEWRRLYRIGEGRANIMDPPSRYGIGEINETMPALKSFFAGQNFEQAEQWEDAAKAYREVVMSPDDRAPIEDAAERLKFISKKLAASKEAAPTNK